MGILKVKIISAKGVADTDRFLAGDSDPYVVVVAGGKEQQTKTIDDNLNPTWNETYQFDIADTANEIVNFIVWDADSCKQDKIIGSCAASLIDLVEGQGVRKALPILRSGSEGCASGFLNVELTAMDFTGLQGVANKIENDLRNEVVKLQETEQRLSGEVDRLSEVETKLSKHVEDLGGELARLRVVEGKLSASVEKLKETEQRLSGEVDRLTEVETRLTKSVEDLSGEVSRLKEVEAKLNSAVDELKQTEQRLNGEVDRLTEVETKLNKNVEDLSSEVSRLKEVEAKLNSAVDELKQTEQRLNGEVDRLTEVETKLNQNVEDLSGEVAQLKEVEVKLNGDVASLGQKLKIMSSTVEHLQKVRDELDQQIINLDGQNDRLKSQLDDLKTIQESMQAFAETAGEDFSKFVSQLTSQVKKNEELIDEFAAENAKLKEQSRKQQVLMLLDHSNSYANWDRNVGLSPEEFTTYISWLGKEYASKIREKIGATEDKAFGKLDVDNNGTLDMEEVRAMLEAIVADES